MSIGNPITTTRVGWGIKHGSGGGQVVSVLAFYSDDLSSNPTKDDNFSVKLYLKRNKNKQKEAVDGHLWKMLLHI